ncbi:MAG: flagellar motor protein MotB [Elusimicrobiota bacterium]
MNALPPSAMPPKADLLPTSLWMIPYADLLSNMMILFLALFAFSYDRPSPGFEKAVAKIEQEFAADGQQAVKDARLREAEIAFDIQEAMEGLALQDFGLKVTSRYIHLTLPNPVIFRTGSATLSPKAKEILDPLALIFARVPNPILVRGHTDNVPISRGPYGTNWELSAARSFSVIHYLINRRRLKPARFIVRGYGEHRPVAKNDTLEGRRRNRRIEISIIRQVEETP